MNLNWVLKVYRYLYAQVQIIKNTIKFEISKFIDDKTYIEKKFNLIKGYPIELSNPITYDEKLNWIKLFMRQDRYTSMVDKQSAKDIVKSKWGESLIIPTLGVWDRFDDIEFEKLPNQFILKCTHDSGSIMVCDDKKKFDYIEAKAKLSKALKKNYYWYSREWAYKNVIPRIIAEPYMKDVAGSLYDYKVHCFSGEPMFIELIGNRNLQNHTANVGIYDFNWVKRDWTFGDYPDFGEEIIRPRQLDDLYNISKEMCKDFPYIRIDYYIVNNNILFGEFTFTPSAGFNEYNGRWTKEIDKYLGGLIRL